MNKAGRPSKQPTTVISVPVDRIAAVERALGRPIATAQTPIIKVRIPVALVGQIRKVIKRGRV